MNVGSLFAGVGGICLGFKNAGFNLSWANEFDPYASETYRHNFKHNLIQGNIEEILYSEEPEFVKLRNKIISYKTDILTGGFPCQAFSLAGERLGFLDQRGNLFYAIPNLIKLMKHKPRVLFLENVKNLKNHNSGKTFKTITSTLESLGYKIKSAVLNTYCYTELPQNRERIFLLCFLNQEDYDNFTMFENLDLFYKKWTKENIVSFVEGIIDNEESSDYYMYTKTKYPHFFSNNDKTNMDLHIKDKNEFYQIRRNQYIRKNAKGICPTLTANMGTGGHNITLVKTDKGVRKLTELECFKLQGFPIGNGFSFPELYGKRPFPRNQLYKQAGNSVSVKVIELIATELFKALSKSSLS